MHLSVSRKSGPLPTRFPVGTRYVVEGRGGENGELRVFSRYVVLPGGRRINLPNDLGTQTRARRARHGQAKSSMEPERGPTRAKKNLVGGGTTRRRAR